ncbi:MAG: DEAD/DEAH box helicase [Planctomycetaceae bacterium]|jgi:SNF2 family DNA or RNA helicase|nr:DEAD/DEAH box helicase [Planctomycetaceae bacterium]
MISKKDITQSSESENSDSLEKRFYSLEKTKRDFIALLAIYTAPAKREFIRVLCSIILNSKLDEPLHGLHNFIISLRKDDWLEVNDPLIACNPNLRESIIRLLVEKNEYNDYANKLFAKIGRCFINNYGFRTLLQSNIKTEYDYIREFRHMLINPESVSVLKMLDAITSNNIRDVNLKQTVIDFCTNEKSKIFLEKAETCTRVEISLRFLNDAIKTLDENYDPLWDFFIQTAIDNNSPDNDESIYVSEINILTLDYAFITGRIEDEKLDRLQDDLATSLLAAQRAFFAGNYETACANYRTANKLFHQKITTSGKSTFPFLSGIFYALTELRTGNQPVVAKFAEVMSKSRNEPTYMRQYSGKWQTVWKIIDAISQRVIGQCHENINFLDSLRYDEITPKWIAALLCYYEKIWFNLDNVIKFSYVSNSNKTKVFSWVTSEFLDVVKESNLQTIINQTLLKKFRAKKNYVPLRNLFSYRNNWELVLESLQSVANVKDGGKTSARETEKKTRLVWRVDAEPDNLVSFYPYEQLWDKKSQSWTSGKPIVLSRLFRYQNKLDYLTQQDREICSTISVKTYAHSRPEYYLMVDVADKFVGHPLLFSYKEPNMRVELLQGHGEISMEEKVGKLLVTFSPTLKSASKNYYSAIPQDDNNREFFVVSETPYRFKVVHLSKQEIQLRKILGEKGQIFPKNAELALTDWMSKMTGSVIVKTDASIEFANIPELPPDQKLYIYLTPRGDGVMSEFFVKPLGSDGPTHRPGVGSERIIAEIDKENVQTVRNLAGETERRNKFIAKINSFRSAVSLLKDQYLFETPLDALNFLSELRDVEQNQLNQQIQQNSAANETKTKKNGKKKNELESASEFEIYWTQGEKFKVTSTATFKNMRLSFSTMDNWLSAEGAISVDGQVVELRRILELLPDNTDERFIKLDEKNYLSLTSDLRKRLGELKRLSHTKGKLALIHPYVAANMDEFFDAIPTLKHDEVWLNIRKRIEAARDFQPIFPAGLAGDLRDYQLEGYEWLSRCAQWGVGCCLADDMGLGKTVQGLALLLSRADLGAALVVAPTSVCFNWEREAERFAPSLNIKRILPINGMNLERNERDELILSGGCRDVLITSYSLLQQEIELFSKVKFSTVILDESQAIKNPDSNRAKAAARLQSDFRVGMTGTPIENNLVEFWSLFRFLNPGLLGSQKSFEKRFAVPIQREGSSAARSALKRMVHPFILRRTKSQVLEELPPRTEILREIELSSEELILYEAARERALDELSSVKDKESGRGRLQILAALTRLRQICCNPKLVMPDCGIVSSKMEVFREIMLELRASRHKVLVFSQFVKHLDLLRRELDGVGISYQYLDGSTLERDRARRVDAFQAGKSDAFLISIKAGGSGLNLTMADYVIHTDPWWNPAVEDQATNRAHRIGQIRPVTVYRLITKGTIEEKIVRLHHEKRDLADKLLSGTEKVSKLTSDELISILGNL